MSEYRIVLADPPWQFRRGGDHGMRTADSFYQTMNLADIAALGYPWLFEQCAPSCVLFLWTTCATLREARYVMSAWGFAYKTVAFTWVKLNKRPLTDKAYRAAKSAGEPVVLYAEPPDRHPRPYKLKMGMGSYTRQSVELCLLGVRGQLTRQDRGVQQTILAPIREHSRKPDEAYALIDRMYGDVPRLELFARQRWPGWAAWGDELPEVAS